MTKLGWNWPGENPAMSSSAFTLGAHIVAPNIILGRK
jgi:hypothetical protein